MDEGEGLWRGEEGDEVDAIVEESRRKGWRESRNIAAVDMNDTRMSDMKV